MSLCVVFNKRDNINIRLAQIEDYLDKLNKLDEKEKANDKQIVEKTSAKVQKRKLMKLDH